MEDKNTNTFKEGFVKYPRCVLYDLSLTTTEKDVYCAIRSHRQEKTGVMFNPSRQKVADLLGHSLATVKRAIKKLQVNGHITWKRGGTGRANSYQFHCKDGAIREPIAGSPVNPSGVTSEPSTGSSASHLQEPNNLNKKRRGLFFEKDPAKVLPDGTVLIHVPHQQRWAPYGGGDDDKFRYGDLTGTLARQTAIADTRGSASSKQNVE